MIRRWLALVAGCVLLATLSGLVWYVARWFVIPAIAFAVLVFWLGTWWEHRRITRAGREFRRQNPGRPLLIVYTDSPHWKPIIEDEWLPRWGDRVVTLNRSRPWSRDQLEARLWRSVRSIEHTPLAILVRPDDSVHVVRLFYAFRDNKHGKAARLRTAEADIDTTLASISAQ